MTPHRRNLLRPSCVIAWAGPLIILGIALFATTCPARAGDVCRSWGREIAPDHVCLCDLNPNAPCIPPATFTLHFGRPPYTEQVRYLEGAKTWTWAKTRNRACSPEEQAYAPLFCAAAIGQPVYTTQRFYIPATEAVAPRLMATTASPLPPRPAYRLTGMQSIERDGMRYSAPRYLFVAFPVPPVPIGTHLLVNRSESLNITTPYWTSVYVIQGNGADVPAYAVLPIANDLRAPRSGDQYFEVRTVGGQSGAPFIAPIWYSDLPARTCADLRIEDCTTGRRRAVRP